MTQIVLAGVGGQGILTIAKLLSSAGAKSGLHVKQAEVHGMSQRGGAVQAHVRLANKPLHTERILAGTADLVLATEPLEAVRQQVSSTALDQRLHLRKLLWSGEADSVHDAPFLRAC